MADKPITVAEARRVILNRGPCSEARRWLATLPPNLPAEYVWMDMGSDQIVDRWRCWIANDILPYGCCLCGRPDEAAAVWPEVEAGLRRYLDRLKKGED